MTLIGTSTSHDTDREAAHLHTLHCWAKRGEKEQYIGFILSNSDIALECPDDAKYPNSASAFRRVYTAMYTYSEKGWELYVNAKPPACRIVLDFDPEEADNP